MKKLIYSIFTLITLSILVGACSSDSYEKRLKKDKKAIKNLIADSGFTIKYDRPEVGYKFAKGEFYYDDSTGIYIRIKDWGDLNKVPNKKYKTKVLMRFDSLLYLVKTKNNNDSVPNTNKWAGVSPLELDYGDSKTYVENSGNVSSIGYNYLSPACARPLDLGVGFNAHVSLIVPFYNGSSFQQRNYEPFYYGDLSYRFNEHSATLIK